MYRIHETEEFKKSYQRLKHGGVRECHIQGDLLLVYKIEQGVLVLALLDIGSHAYLFG